MNIRYLLHPHNGEYAGTLFVHGADDRLQQLLNRLSSWGGNTLMPDEMGGRWWEIPAENWDAAIACVSFAGGTQTRKWG